MAANFLGKRVDPNGLLESGSDLLIAEPTLISHYLNNR